MRYVLRNENLHITQEQMCIAKKLGISTELLKLLIGRGIKEDEVEKFLHPSLANLSSPFEIADMDIAVERVRRAIANGEKILIYGDYDCDGICAVSILMLFLRDKTNVEYFIPDRNRDGYGMTLATLERLIKRYAPKLVVTVDCGITAVEEARYLSSLGIDLIVTDHHEPQEGIPSCTVVDPKVYKKGFYELCGAGVALKLVEALSDRKEAEKYLDIAAIATIADVVPLMGDNRIIAYFGLKQMQKSPRTGIKLLLGEDTLTSQNIMFRLAPRINAAGRVKSAMKVVDLFLQSDYFMLKTLAEELVRDNTFRQELCENTVREAKEMLRGEDFSKTGFIALYSESWEAGVLGIAAAKLVEDFKRPAILFSKCNDMLKGSARSIPAVNIFELFSNLNGYFVSFGGHAQAAGASLKAENFEAFKQDANELIMQRHSLADFDPPIKCEMELPLDYDFLPFAQELKLLEPTGYGNPRPNFLIKGEGLKFERIGFSNHVKYHSANLDILGFSSYAESLFAKTGKAAFEVSLDVNSFRNELSAQGILRSVDIEGINLSEDEALCLNLHHLEYECEKTQKAQYHDAQYLASQLKASPFGTLVVCFSAEEYADICAACEEIGKLPCAIGSFDDLNPKNAVIICPNRSFDFGYYDNVAIAGRALTEGYSKHISESAKNVYAVTDDASPRRLKITDGELRIIYRELAELSARLSKAGNMRALYLRLCERHKTDEYVFMTAMKVFEELNLVSIGARGTLIVNKRSVVLGDSKTYRNLLHN